MPRNFKEALIFTLLMCSVMVLGMTSWNLFLSGHFSLAALVTGFFFAFIVAFALDMLLVGPIAKKLAFKIPFDKSKRWQTILAVSGSMLVGMVTCMSLFGLLVNGLTITPGLYAKSWLTNLVMALPLNFLVAGPISRLILTKLQQKWLAK